MVRLFTRGAQSRASSLFISFYHVLFCNLFKRVTRPIHDDLHLHLHYTRETDDSIAVPKDGRGYFTELVGDDIFAVHLCLLRVCS